ncbi:DUF2726 domain-containing protein [uncultured Roseibium sp.]|uniref:DUF2726 domain-containing protein n=1 Tax=uncultured Roseibium sp. TaxID=1936171 RepID=UPI002627E274|nr:DUF2726 domain-containing protein [uncultured Roseibium sp.]
MAKVIETNSLSGISAEIAEILEKIDPLLVFVFVVGVLAGMAIETFLRKRERIFWKRKKQTRQWPAPPKRNLRVVPSVRPGKTVDLRDAAEQLRIVMEAKFQAQPLLNKSEARVFRELDRVVVSRNPDWQVMAQVSLGEILKSESQDAYSCINSKRVDLLLVDENCLPRHVIEYQGTGHHQGTAAARDAVKKEALRRAGIRYHEVIAGFTMPADLRLLVEKVVQRPAEPPSVPKPEEPLEPQ